MLENLLRQGLSLLDTSGPLQQTPRRPEAADRTRHRPGAEPAPRQTHDRRGMDWTSFGAGAATGSAATGALGLLLGRKQVQRHAGKVLKYGGIAAIGLMAWQAWSRWQADAAARTPASPASPPLAGPLAAPSAAVAQPSGMPPHLAGTGHAADHHTAQAASSPPPGRGLPWPTTSHAHHAHHAPLTPAATATVPEAFDAAHDETRSRALLQAMIAAAKADGHLDARERELLDAELMRLAGDHALRDWMRQELDRPLDPAAVARAAGGDPALAAQMYLASLLVADEQNFMERAWLDELARQLGLEPALQRSLEAQAGEAAAREAID
jgi:uncharacterized membrane protein YebE (DUF533 family)